MKNGELLAEIMAANYSEDLKNEVKELMIAGMSDTEISRAKNITTDTLRAWRKNFSLPPSSGGNNFYSDEIKNKAYGLMKENLTNKQISEALQISTTTIANWRNSANIPNSTKSQNSRKYSPEVKKEALVLMSEGMTNSEVNKLLDVHTDTLRNWRKKAGIEPSSGGKKTYTVDQINDVIDLIREGNTVSEISRISGVNQRKIREIRNEEVRNGNPLPEFIKGISRIQKYSDEELIDLVYLNPGYGLNRFIDLLGIRKNFFFDLSLDFKDFTEGEIDLVSILQDESHGRMVSRNEYYEIIGNDRAPRGMGAGTGGRKPKPDRIGPQGRLLKDVYLPPQNFNWGSIKPKVWRKKKSNEIIWIEQRLGKKGYLSSEEDREDFVNETGAGKTKFNKWMNKAGLIFDKKMNRWYKFD